MQITAAQVKELRDRTGAGMMECKSALVEAGGDFDRAEEELKIRGLATAKKREERETNEGRIFVKRRGTVAALLELRCETDFVSLNEKFTTLGTECVGALLSDDAERIDSAISDTISVIKENIVRGRSAVIVAAHDELMVEYVHGAGSHASIVKLACPSAMHARVQPVAHELALHIVARAPSYVAPEDVPAELQEEAEARFRSELEELGKPETLWQKIVAGRWRKYLREHCLLLQQYLKDEDLSVGEWLEAESERLGTALRVTGFAYVGVHDQEH